MSGSTNSNTGVPPFLASSAGKRNITDKALPYILTEKTLFWGEGCYTPEPLESGSVGDGSGV